MTPTTLEQLGFSKKESEIYLLLLQHGQLSPAEIAQLSRISRPTVYSVAKTLVQKGIVIEDLGGPTRSFIAKPPEDLIILANREEKELTRKKDLIKKAANELQSFALSAKYNVPKIVFIGEDEIETYLYKQTPAWNASMLERDPIYCGFQDHTLVETFETWIHWYWKQPPSSIVVQLLTNVSEIETRMKRREYERRKMKFWDQAARFTTTTWVMGDYVTLINTRVHPFSLIEIHDQAFAENFRQIFKGIWNTIG